MDLPRPIKKYGGITPSTRQDNTPPRPPSQPPKADAVAIADRAVNLVERWADALMAISIALADDSLSDAGKVMRVRLILAGLDRE